VRVALAALLATAVASAPGPGRLQTSAHVLAFAQDGGRAAWLGGPRLEVHEGTLGGGGAASIGDAFGDQCLTMVTPLLALAGTRALWTDTLRGSAETDVDLWTGAPGEEQQLIEELRSDSAYGDGDFVSSLAGDGANLVYSVVTIGVPVGCRSGGSCDLAVTDGRTMLVSPKAKVRWLQRVPPAARMAVAGDTLAVAPVVPAGAPQGLLPYAHGFEVYRISTGKRLAHVPVADQIVGLGASPTTVAVLTRGAAGAAITLYADGRLLSTTRVLASAADVSVAGKDVVYRTGRTIRLLGRAQALAVADGTPVGLSVEGARVAWADSQAAGGHLHTLPLP
jgi:hypothetical protein